MVRVRLNVSPKELGWYQSSLQATEQEGLSTLVWRRLPGFSLNAQQPQNWANDSTLRYFKLRLEATGEDTETMACLF